MRKILCLDGKAKDSLQRTNTKWTSFTLRYPDSSKETYYIERYTPWKIPLEVEIAFTRNTKALKGYLNWKFVRGLRELPAA